MPVIKNVYTDDAGVPLKREWVAVTLISRAGYSKTGQYRAVRVHSDLTDSTGLWTSPDLPPQSSYEESGTYYQVTCAGRVDSFDVPDTGGPYWLADRRRNPVPIDADWKVLAKLVELPDALALAGATDGQGIAYELSTKTWKPTNRVTAQNLADAVAPKAAQQFVIDTTQALSNRISPLETWKPTVDTALAQRATIASVTGVSDKVTQNTSDITALQGRVATVEGGGSGATGAVQHGSLRYLVTKADGSSADDHPQYLTPARGDLRYLKPTDASAAYAGLLHAARHKTGGADALAPADIGAATAGHLVESHPANGQIQPLIFVKTADASSSNLAHAGLATDVPSDSTPRLRSVRQPIVHPVDANIDVELGNSANSNTVYYTDFVVRESCNLWFDVNVFHNISYAGTAAAATGGGGWFGVTFYDMTNGGGSVWADGAVGYYASFNATYDWKPTTMTAIKKSVGYAFQRGVKYRFQIYATKQVSAVVHGWYVRGGIHEMVQVTG